MKNRKKNWKKNRHKRMSKMFLAVWDELNDREKRGAFRLAQEGITIEFIRNPEGTPTAIAVEFDSSVDPQRLAATIRTVEAVWGKR